VSAAPEPCSVMETRRCLRTPVCPAGRATQGRAKPRGTVLLVAGSGAHVTVAQTDALPMQRSPTSACRGPALTRSDLGESDRAPQRRCGSIGTTASSPLRSREHRQREGKSSRAEPTPRALGSGRIRASGLGGNGDSRRRKRADGFAPREGESPTGTGLTSQWAFCESGGSGGLEPFGVVNSGAGFRRSEVGSRSSGSLACGCRLSSNWPAVRRGCDERPATMACALGGCG
jgi:hypothetical protein